MVAGPDTAIRIEHVINELRKERPIFHSDADLQHALAWEIHRHQSAAAVRLEINQGFGGQREYIDILVKEDGSTAQPTQLN